MIFKTFIKAVHRIFLSTHRRYNISSKILMEEEKFYVNGSIICDHKCYKSSWNKNQFKFLSKDTKLFDIQISIDIWVKPIHFQ